MSNLNIAQIPNVFGLRDFIASKFGKESIFSRFKNFLGRRISAVGEWLSPKKTAEPEASTQKQTEPVHNFQTTPLKPESAPIPTTPFYDFTRDDLGLGSDKTTASGTTPTTSTERTNERLLQTV